MDNEMDHLLTLLVEPPSAGWRQCMRIRHCMPSWTFAFFTDRFHDRFRDAEIYNNRRVFDQYAASSGHREFMKFWCAKTIEIFSWTNYLEWSKISHIRINGIRPQLMCPVCKRQNRPCSSRGQWRNRWNSRRGKFDHR